MTRFEDFRIRISRGQIESQYRVHVDAPSGQATDSTFSMPFSEDALENFILKVGKRHVYRSVRSLPTNLNSQDIPKRFGQQLFEALFTQRIIGLYERALSEVEAKSDVGLRIILHLQEVPELANIPWEFMYDGNQQRFLNLNFRTPIIRTVDLPVKQQPIRVKGALQILVSITDPEDQTRLDIDHEKTLLKSIFEPLEQTGLVKLKFTDNGTFSNFIEKLQEARDTRAPFHIWHHIGHGEFHEGTGLGRLAFEAENRRTDAIDATTLSQVLQNFTDKLRLISLNSCEGARASTEDSFASIAMSLIAQRCPAVIGMQFEITDEAAIAFSNKFYSAIANGKYIEEAVTEARLAIFSNKQNQIEWGTPVLFLRSKSGRLFEVGDKPTDENREEYPESIPNSKPIKTKSRSPRNPEVSILSTKSKGPSWKLDLADVDEGEFIMGTSEAKINELIGACGKDWFRNEGKQKKDFFLPTYRISQDLITVKQFRDFVMATNYSYDVNLDMDDDLPITNVNCIDVEHFCTWLSEHLDGEFLLPSEAEWEKACRGGLIILNEPNPCPDRSYPWGDDRPDDRLCNLTGDIIPVRQRMDGHSPYFCYDMVGDVWQWTRSIETDLIDQLIEVTDNPKKYRAYRRVIRGGSAFSELYELRSSMRGFAEFDYRYPEIGFRVIQRLAKAK